MKIFFTALYLMINAHTANANSAAMDKVIYGEDNRRLLRDLDADFYKDEMALGFSRSVLAQIPNWRIDTSNPETITIKTRDLKHGLNFCDGESFLEMPIVSSCTAFLVGPDLIVTAGHCIKDKYDCKKQTWVLDYDSSMDFISPNGAISFDKNKTYACSELVSWSSNSKLDYAIVRLDRKIEGVAPLKIRREGKTSSKEELMAIGHPLGMPKMVTDNILIRDNTLDYVFKTNADTFSGNSGSPVIGFSSGLVEGVLIRGEDDFQEDFELGCKRPMKCQGSECRGESVQRSTYLPFKHIPKI